MKSYLYYGIIFFLAGWLFLTACNKDYFELDRLSKEIEWEPKLVAPLIHGSMTLGDIVERVDSLGFTDVDNEGLIYIVYKDTTFSVRADTIVDIPDKFYTETYIDSDINTPIWIGSAVGDTMPFFKNELFAFELEANDRVDSILIKGGEIVVDMMSSFEHMGILTISSPQILNVERDTFFTSFEISDITGGFVAQKIFFSDGYCLKPSARNDSSFIQINFRLDLINSGNPVNPDDLCEIKTSFRELDFYKVFGYIDSRNLIDESGDIDIPLFTENPDFANIIFADPRINIYTSTSIGIPLEVELNNVVATSSRDGSQVELNFTGDYPLQISAPGIDQVGERVDSVIRINRTTSNIDELLASAPSGITYNFIGRTAAGSGIDQHFVLDTSVMDLSLEFVLPLDFKSSRFSLEDTIEFGLFEDSTDLSMIKLVQVDLTTTNELPIQLEVELYLLDDAYNVIVSIFEDGEAVLLAASQVDNQGKTVQAMEETNSITLSAEKIARLEDVSHLMFVASMITSEGGAEFVKLYSHYSLDFDLSVIAEIRVNADLDRDTE